MKNSGQKGFSIIEAVIASGLLSILILAFVQMNKMHTEMAVSMETRFQELQVIREIESYLTTPESCTHTFVGTCIDQTRTTPETCTYAGKAWVDGKCVDNNLLSELACTLSHFNWEWARDTGVPYKVGEEFDKIYTKQGRLRFQASPIETGDTNLYGDRSIRLLNLKIKNVNIPASGGFGFIETEITMKRIKKGFSGQRERTLTIPIELVANGPTAEIVSCVHSTQATMRPKCNWVGEKIMSQSPTCGCLGNTSQVLAVTGLCLEGYINEFKETCVASTDCH